MTQRLAFENEVRRIYFGVDVFNPSGSIDSFKSIRSLKYNDTVVHSENLNRAIADKKTRLSRYRFSFATNPFADLKIHSGEIFVWIEETRKLKKLVKTELQIDFQEQSDAEHYFNKLKEIFNPISTKENLRDFEGRQTAHYSSAKESEKSTKNILISMRVSTETRIPHIVITSFNSFKIE
jgi:hypothetical protein